MSEVIRRTVYDEQEDKMYHSVSQDEEPILEFNQAIKNAQPEHFKYLNGKPMFHAAKISMVGIEKMANGQCCPDGKKYRLFSPDPEERKRALLHVQSCHPEYMLVDGKPIAKKKTTWQ